MEEPTVKIETIDAYISRYDGDIQAILQEFRRVIKEEAPDATEKISYQMPTFYLNGNLVHFAVQKNHIGFYPAPSGVAAFKEELTEYKTSKGAIQFPLTKPIPYELVRRIVRFRVEEAKQNKKQSK
ncbi:iron chaperone [Trichococcus collinsii]|uniref:Uncharacterized conserved protein YdhG, YjbR/CyaY-like superfamily, DUF1801 family n=1 Tax=Trichococcus collinsii TaxID=157076 RepID=A0AB38A0K5_9LACT|nr:DUF1801 domain-containing protein [Trichococcus collinsii]CZR06847.1 Hypothetical protein Tcol_2456 [Trichococcus collinsii]SEA30497.1 Uncharacterized conserved protein YdhG, YjbR/CyaY-like superfamily, DUF1801 family [Trichococcus collinsii]